MADVKISLLQAAGDADRAVLTDCVAEVRRSVCSEIKKLASLRLQLPQERITVQITAPPQERMSL